MQVRPDLLPPVLDEARVARLAELADRIDGAPESACDDDLAAFNAEAGTALAWLDFQGIYGGQDHDTWVRQVLAEPFEKRIPDITREELLELIRRVRENDGELHKIAFWLRLLEVNLDPRISDLIFWPGE